MKRIVAIATIFLSILLTITGCDTLFLSKDSVLERVAFAAEELERCETFCYESRMDIPSEEMTISNIYWVDKKNGYIEIINDGNLVGASLIYDGIFYSYFPTHDKWIIEDDSTTKSLSIKNLTDGNPEISSWKKVDEGFEVTMDASHAIGESIVGLDYTSATAIYLLDSQWNILCLTIRADLPSTDPETAATISIVYTILEASNSEISAKISDAYQSAVKNE